MQQPLDATPVIGAPTLCRPQGRCPAGSICPPRRVRDRRALEAKNVPMPSADSSAVPGASNHPKASPRGVGRTP